MDRMPATPFLRAGLSLAAVAALAACTSAPTYGTGTRSDVQLVQDISSIMSISSKNKASEIDYKPRPGVIAPASTATLPAPQASVIEQPGAWPETPEQRRARIRAEATANQSNPLYRSPVINTGFGQVQERTLTPEEQRQRFREGRAIQSGAYTGRRFLSDPPEALKVPADTAPIADLGEPERKKEARRKKAAKKSGGFKIWPW
jgi:hypothetical protein